MRPYLLLLFLALGARPGVADAQTEGRGPTGARVEVGAGVGAVSVLPTYGAHLALAVAGNHSVELTGTGMMYSWYDDHVRFFVGQVQWRSTVRRHPGRQLFVTVGGTITARYEHPPEYRFTRPDGSVFVHPESRSWRVDQPSGVHAGIGGQYALRGRTVIRWDAQMIVSGRPFPIPIGRASFSVVRLFGRTQ